MSKGTISVSVILGILLALPSVAQTPGGSVRGRIFDADTGQQITKELNIEAALDVAFPPGSRQLNFAGEFVLPDLQPGTYRLQIREKGNRFPLATRNVRVTAGTAINRADIYLRLPGEIEAVVVDSSGGPVQGSTVILATKGYVFGHATYTFSQQLATDDRGHVTFTRRVEPGHPYFLVALPPETNRPTLSGTPSLEAAWYPGRPGILQPFVLRSAEKKTIGIVMRKTQSHCVDGTLTADGLPAALEFEIAIPEVAGYVGLSGGTRGVVARGKSETSGHFRVCGLWPAEYIVTSGLSKAFYGRTKISVADKDVRDLTLNARSPVSLPVEIRWDSAQQPDKTFWLQLLPFTRATFRIAENVPVWEMETNGTPIVIPSKSSVTLPAFTDYIVAGGILPIDSDSGAYVKEVLCDGTVSRNTLKLGGVPCNLYITIGTDKGQLAATIVDKDNNPEPNALVCLAPASAASREEIAETGTCSLIDDPVTGSVSISVPSGRYLAMVMPPGTSDWADYIVTNRARGEFVELKASSTVPLKLKSDTR